ncbi:MAG TPA: NAD(P)/FAD-dependent oxidoreductase [Pyrinomonadaceae bacterium]|nr:NAD(P)/FAD-dependent oxidoreductase [Pyrinomonadaceae bacterium]
MTGRIVIVGAGMGGLTSAIRLARAGLSVRVVEARAAAGGLASGFEQDGFTFDAGPYILLDRPGLEWAFQSLGLELTEHLTLRPIEDVYEVSSSQGASVRFHMDLEETASGLDRNWPGSGRRYEQFVAETRTIYRRISPVLRVSQPGLRDLLHGMAWMHLPFLLKPLGSILARTGLPPTVVDAIAIWTHAAGQTVDQAPSPMAFVPVLIHTAGAFYPDGGMAAIPRALAKAAAAAGVEFRFETKVRKILCERGRVRGVETDQGEFIAADAVVSNYSGVGTYLELIKEAPSRVRERLRKLPLQSPGACAYLAVQGEAKPPYLHFRLPGRGRYCRLLATPAVIAPELRNNGWWPARLIAPMNHTVAQRTRLEKQREYLDEIVRENWWREHVSQYRVLATRVPAEWGAQFNLYRDSMNPVVTARSMRDGYLAHRSPYVRGLYLAGSSTHPGQWVSFCAISGVLAAESVLEDLD